MDARDTDEADPHRAPDLHDLSRELQARKMDLLASAGREAELHWIVDRLRRDVEAAAAREAALLAEVEAAAERLAAMRTVADAGIASAGPFGFRRRRFLALVRRAAQAVPDDGPGSARHAVLDAEARRLLSR